MERVYCSAGRGLPHRRLGCSALLTCGGARVQAYSLCLLLCHESMSCGCVSPALTGVSWFQELQNICASEGQVVVLECRVRGTPPLRVCWFRQGSEIQDSPDFRILQKSKQRGCPQHHLGLTRPWSPVQESQEGFNH